MVLFDCTPHVVDCYYAFTTDTIDDCASVIYCISFYALWLPTPGANTTSIEHAHASKPTCVGIHMHWLVLPRSYDRDTGRWLLNTVVDVIEERNLLRDVI